MGFSLAAIRGGIVNGAGTADKQPARPRAQLVATAGAKSKTHLGGGLTPSP